MLASSVASSSSPFSRLAAAVSDSTVAEGGPLERCSEEVGGCVVIRAGTSWPAGRDNPRSVWERRRLRCSLSRKLGVTRQDEPSSPGAGRRSFSGRPRMIPRHAPSGLSALAFADDSRTPAPPTSSARPAPSRIHSLPLSPGFSPPATLPESLLPWSPPPTSPPSRPRPLPATDVTIHTNPGVLPEEPREVDDRFSILPERVQRALRAGLSVTEPGYHVFVSTPPEMCIEEDLAVAASRVAASRPLPPGTWSSCSTSSARRSRSRCSSPPPAAPSWPTRWPSAYAITASVWAGSRGRTPFGRRNGSWRRSSDGAIAQTVSDLETPAKALGFGVRAVQGACRRSPSSTGSRSRRAVQRARRVHQEGARRGGGELSDVVEKAASRVRAMTDEVEAARDDALQQAAERIVVREIAHVATRSPTCREV